MRKKFILSVFLIILIELYFFYYLKAGLWSLIIIMPILSIGLHDILQNKHALLKNFPVIGWGRWVFETLRPKIYQYFIESDIDGRPIERIHRSLVYQRAKGDIATTPFGTQLDVFDTISEILNTYSRNRTLREIPMALPQGRYEDGAVFARGKDVDGGDTGRGLGLLLLRACVRHVVSQQRQERK